MYTLYRHLNSNEPTTLVTKNQPITKVGYDAYWASREEEDEPPVAISENLYYPIGYGTPNTSTRDGFKSGASGYTASKSVAVTAGDVIYYGPYSVNEAIVFITDQIIIYADTDIVNNVYVGHSNMTGSDSVYVDNIKLFGDNFKTP